MDILTVLLFSLTVFPLICTPGPDMLFIASQAIGGNAGAGLRATAGVCTGYCVHSLLVAFGLAALIVASPTLFAAIRWVGVVYLAYLAGRLIRSALRPGNMVMPTGAAAASFRRGFLTAVLNPKGMLIYFALLPQFMHAGGSVAQQALVLSLTFISLCAAFYAALSGVLAAAGRSGGFNDRYRRWVEGVSGGLLLTAAAKLAVD